MKYKNILKFIFVLCVMLIGLAPKAHAQLCCTCAETTEKYMNKIFYGSESYIHAYTYEKDPTVVKAIRHIEGEFTSHKQWLVGVVWEDNILPAMMMMTDEITNVGMKQIEMVGQLMDAKIQLDAQQAIQLEEAKSNQLYSPSTGMCEIATNTKSLSATERRAEITKHALNQRSLARHLGRVGTSAYSGRDTNSESRLRQFQENYCNPLENRNGMSGVCTETAQISFLNRNRFNRDIDFVRFMESPWTINVNFTDDKATHNEEDLLSLASNLYGHEVPRRPLSDFMRPNKSNGQEQRGATSLQSKYLELRSLLAKRGVAEDSFNELAALKSSGSSGSREYMVQLLGNFGIPVNEGLLPTDVRDNEASQILTGDDVFNTDPNNPLARPNPSYYAQMEILTKKMFQDPNFYMNLYDKPINVTRKEVSLQAIGLMQKFDVFKSYLRQEAAISMLLELAIADIQNEIENEINE